MSRSFSFSCNAASRWAMATLRSSASATFSVETFSMIDVVDELLLEKQWIGRQIIETNHAQMATQKSRESPANSRFLSSSQRSVHSAWSHFPPVQAVEKNRELRSSQRDHAVLNRWPRSRRNPQFHPSC